MRLGHVAKGVLNGRQLAGCEVVQNHLQAEFGVGKASKLAAVSVVVIENGSAEEPRAALLEVGSLDTPGDARQVFASGDLAFVADGPGGLRIVNVSDPTAPVELSALDTADARHIFVSGSLAFVTDREGGLDIVDVSDPTGPVKVGALDTLRTFLDT